MSYLITETEALTKWCPMSQVAVGPSDDIVANTLSGRAVTCAGSACMVWRKSTEAASHPVGVEPEGDGWRKEGLPTGLGGAVTHRQNWVRDVGWCGLVR